MIKKLTTLIFILAMIGLADALYLTNEHFANIIPPCSNHVILFADCGKVLTSKYSEVAGIPLALFGVGHYLLMGLWVIWGAQKGKALFIRFAVLQSIAGFLFSLYFVYLQLVVIQAICLYCMVSAIISTVIFILTQIVFARERKLMTVEIMANGYTKIVKKIFFRLDPEKIHNLMVKMGEMIGSLEIVRGTIVNGIRTDLPTISQTVDQLKFAYPIGLAAGFDYEARLTKTLSPWGFGFQTVGTITNKAYGGNTPPMLGRLPKSKSLMVNKGFKNPGAAEIVKKLSPISFDVPIGISIGRSNSRELKSQQESVEDVVATFLKFEKSEVKHAYYELNISCPNLSGEIEFYTSKNLIELLNAVDELSLSRPVFVKMPIEKTEKETLGMLTEIAKHNIRGVIFGNLQKNKNHSSLDPNEVSKFSKGYFSGKPTFEDSNKMIRLAYKNFKDRFIIIGCGGVFSAQDAYEKIKSGATLVQLITGMIYEGPQLIMQINFGLETLVRKDGYKNISEAVGKGVQ